MNKIFTILVISVIILSCSLPLNAQLSRQALLRDGIVLRGAVGKFIEPDSNDTCFFELSAPINDNGLIIETGTKIELLPSSALETMIEDVKTHASAMYQLWNAKVTKYKGKNYIFPSFFIRFNPPSETEPSKETKTGKTPPTDIAEPNTVFIDANDSLALPPEVLERLNAARAEMNKTGRRTVDSNIVTIDTVLNELYRKRQLNHDTVLLDKPAILTGQGTGELEFTMDSIGRNIDHNSLRLLPCEVLEQTEQKQSASPEPLRFKISGIVTKYKGNNYLLLYKATQIYSLGNFPG